MNNFQTEVLIDLSFFIICKNILLKLVKIKNILIYIKKTVDILLYIKYNYH